MSRTVRTCGSREQVGDAARRQRAGHPVGVRVDRFVRIGPSIRLNPMRVQVRASSRGTGRSAGCRRRGCGSESERRRSPAAAAQDPLGRGGGGQEQGRDDTEEEWTGQRHAAGLGRQRERGDARFIELLHRSPAGATQFAGFVRDHGRPGRVRRSHGRDGRGTTVPLTNQVAVVTGASSGIGWALAEELARKGCRLGLIARRGDLLDQLADKLRGTGATVEVAVADVADRDRLLQAFAELRSKLGPVDLLIANAGVNTPTPARTVRRAGPVAPVPRQPVRRDRRRSRRCCRRCSPGGAGRIAAVSSLGADRGIPPYGAYCASKAALNTYMDALRVQVRGRGVSVTTLVPRVRPHADGARTCRGRYDS